MTAQESHHNRLSNPSGISIESPTYGDTSRRFIRSRDSLGNDVFPVSLFENINLLDTGEKAEGYIARVVEVDDQQRPLRVFHAKTEPDFIDHLYSAFTKGTTKHVPIELLDVTSAHQVFYRYDQENRVSGIVVHEINMFGEQQVHVPKKEMNFHYDADGRIVIRATTEFGEQTGLGDTTIWQYRSRHEGLEVTQFKYSALYWKDLRGGANAHTVNKEIVNKEGREIAFTSYERPMGMDHPEGNYTNYSVVKVWPTRMPMFQEINLHSPRRKNEDLFPSEIVVPSFLTLPDLEALLAGADLSDVGTDGLASRPIKVRRFSEYISDLSKTKGADEALKLGDAVLRGRIDLLTPKPEWFTQTTNLLKVMLLNESQKIGLLSFFVKGSVNMYMYEGTAANSILDSHFWSYVKLFMQMDRGTFSSVLHKYRSNVFSTEARRYIDTLLNLEHVLMTENFMDEWGDNIFE